MAKRFHGSNGKSFNILGQIYLRIQVEIEILEPSGKSLGLKNTPEGHVDDRFYSHII